MGNTSGRVDDIVGDAEMDEGGRDSSASADRAPHHPSYVPHASSVTASDSLGTPPRPHSPRMFVPQSPVTPLQRAAEGPPPFNQILMNEQQEEIDGPPPKLIPTLLEWNLGGSNVSIEGSWDNWKSKTPIEKSGKDYAILLALPSGVYRYRFIVDGERRIMPELPCETDNMGNITNLVIVNDFVPEILESITEMTTPPSPDSSYCFRFPDDKEFTKEPPALPAQLYLSVLNSSRSSEGECRRPGHVIINHLYIEKGWGAQPMVALGETHRFRSKYVTSVLYKAIER